MFRIKFPTKRIFRIFPILRTGGMAPFGTYLWSDPRITFLCNKMNYFVYLRWEMCRCNVQVSCLTSSSFMAAWKRKKLDRNSDR